MNKIAAQTVSKQGVLEQDDFVPEDATMSVQEMDDVCRDLVASSRAYQQGEVPVRETIFMEGKPYTFWRFVDGPAADLYTVVVKRRPMNVFTASVSELPGCSASGVSQYEALANVRHAIDRWIDTAVAEGRDIPLPSESLTRPVTTKAVA